MSNTANRFRVDVEGLRGLAVLMVIIGHVWIGKVSGGVDVFLMISGFFLIPSLLKHGSSSPEILAPTWRRIKKIITKLWPPMALTIIVTLLLSLTLIPVTKLESNIRDAGASLAYYINWQLGLSDQPYGAANSGASPYQHLWSMSVQAQIFVIVIISTLLIGWATTLAFRNSRISFGIMLLFITLLAGSSFIFANWLHEHDQQLNYYHTFSRLWEILLGGLIGILVKVVKPNATISEILSSLGFCSLFITIIVLDGAKEFPNYLALIPLSAAALIIIGGTNHPTVPTNLLSTKAFTYTGARAYHLYLWHWPILILFIEWAKSQGHSGEIGITQGILIITVSFLLSHVTHWLFSDNISEKLGTTFTWGKYAIPLIVFGSVILLLNNLTKPDTTPISAVSHPGALANTQQQITNPAPLRPLVSKAPTDEHETFTNGCFTNGEQSTYKECLRGDPNGEKTLLVVGGSHTEHYLPALEQIAEENNIRIITILKAGCPLAWTPIMDTPEKIAAQDHCNTWRLKLFDRIEEINPDAILTTSTRPNINAPGDYVPEEYVTAVTKLTSEGQNIIGIRDNPWIVKSNDRTPVDCLGTSKGNPITCGAPESQVLNPTDPAIEAYANIPNLHLIDLTQAFCKDQHCPAAIGNIIVYRDTNHLTRTYVLTMTDYIREQLVSTGLVP